MDKVEVGKYYKNVPTGRICKVISKIFFNVQYNELDDVYHTNPSYCHYKTFRKHWIEVPDPNGD